MPSTVTWLREGSCLLAAAGNTRKRQLAFVGDAGRDRVALKVTVAATFGMAVTVESEPDPVLVLFFSFARPFLYPDRPKKQD